MLLAFVLTFLVTWLLCWVYQSRAARCHPPGPISLPVLGSLLSIRGDVRQALCGLAQKYGDIFTLDLGSQRTIVLASYASIREALVHKATAFSGRPVTLFTRELTLGKGIVPTEGVVWKEHRRFLTNVFREIGVGRQLYEPNIHDEIVFFLKELRKQTSEPYDPRVLLSKATYNVIWRAVFSERYDYRDPLLARRLRLLDQNKAMVASTATLEVLPFLKYIPGDLFGFQSFQDNIKMVSSQLKEKVEFHRLRRSQHDPVPRDVVQAYLDEEERWADTVDPVFTDDQLQAVVQQLSAAGTETTAVTLVSALLHMLNYPDVMQRVEGEIDDVIGPSRMPSMKDIRDMPYTAAVLQEVQRMGDIVPLGIPHRTTREVRLRDYVIPANTQVFAMLHAAHRDPRVYKDPYLFNPERFIAGDQPAEDPPIPFSLGPRRCPGENLAQMELFLFFVAMLQNFHIKQVPGCVLPELLGPPGLTACPKPFEIIFEDKTPST